LVPNLDRMAAPDESGVVASTLRPRGRDRTHLRAGRPHRLNARFTDAELAEIEAAAVGAGMTPTGFLAEAGLAAARGTAPAALSPSREALAELQSELFAARVSVGRIGTNLNQAVTALNSTGEAPAWLAHVVQLCERRMDALDEVIGRIDRTLR
jgi:hypothetical protein